jgi:hypothetical protein
LDALPRLVGVKLERYSTEPVSRDRDTLERPSGVADRTASQRRKTHERSSSRRLNAMTDAETDARNDAGHDAGTDSRFGGLTPSEAAQKRWAGERAREVAADPGGAGDVATDADIVRTLRTKAERGDVNAARELREWRTLESSATQGDLWVELLTPRERQFVRRVIQTCLETSGGSRHP